MAVEPNSNLTKAQDLFILEWGRMSSSWGINRTMAQIHALLFITGQPLEVNEIMERLQISRGNASMNLRELMDWGIVRRFRQPGDRKDTYLSETVERLIQPLMQFEKSLASCQSRTQQKKLRDFEHAFLLCSKSSI